MDIITYIICYLQKIFGERLINLSLIELFQIFIKNNLLGRKSGQENIQWRITLRILNEAARCLEENIITSPMDGDIGAVFGFGFPPMKEGPFHFMDTYGISNIID